jgi:endo-alpha-1,4-polygalactosaminidase (GH114 family)
MERGKKKKSQARKDSLGGGRALGQTMERHHGFLEGRRQGTVGTKSNRYEKLEELGSWVFVYNYEARELQGKPKDKTVADLATTRMTEASHTIVTKKLWVTP